VVECGEEVVGMRWRFWRARSRADPATDPLEAATRPRREAPPARSRPPVPDDPDEHRRPTPAFSGATPEPGRGLLREEPDDSSGLLSDLDAPHLDMTGVRVDVLALVRAALERDRPAALLVLQRLEDRGPDEPGVASLAALAALGDRMAAGAGYGAGGSPVGGAACAAVVAQGDTVAGRAEVLLRAVAPHCSRDLVRRVVRFAAGLPDQEPALVPLSDAPPQDLTLVAAVLLAQTVLDGAGDVGLLAQELEVVVPG
jgi:hypothetical protein